MVHPVARIEAVLGRAIGFAIAAALATSTTAAPQMGSAVPHLTVLTVPEHIGESVLASRMELPPIRAFELGLGGPMLARAVAEGTESTHRDVAELPSLTLTVERELAALWRIRVSAGARLPSIQIGYQVVAGNGAIGRLSNAELPEEEIPVRVVGSAPSVIESDEESTVLEGGATLFLDLSKVRHAGRYVGSVQVTLNHL